MHQKELRIALVCYGGISLAVYMHGVTKELWHLSRASRDFHSRSPARSDVERVYRQLLEAIEAEAGITLRVLPDILTGASAGGINTVLLAQAIHSGQSLDPLTDLWLTEADVDRLTDPDARPIWRFAKFWAQPIASWLLRRPGNAVSESVAPETRAEVRRKVSRLVRGRWFAPPFSGIGFSRLLERAFDAMAQGETDEPLLPPGHPLDLYVTATDFRGYLSLLRLHSPPVAQEGEHRLPIGFRSRTPAVPGIDFADPLELVLAARATASFPGAFPPLELAEIDKLAAQSGKVWSGRDAFIERVLPMQLAQGRLESMALIDGSVLVNKPFEGAIAALQGRPAQREVDRRFVYVDPRPHRFDPDNPEDRRPVGFFGAIFGSLSAIPREQPIRDNLETIEAQSREAMRLQRIVAALRPEVEEAVEKLFGYTLFLDRPTPKRLQAWRQRAQEAAVQQAGYAFEAYAQAKFASIIQRLAKLAHDAAPKLHLPDCAPIEAALRGELARRGFDRLAKSGNATADAVHFFRAHDIAFRIRRLRLLARRLARDWEADPEIPEEALERARDAVYDILALYFEREGASNLGSDFREVAEDVLAEPGALLDLLAERRLLPEVDDRAEQMLAEALEPMPKNLKRRMLLTYLGFPFYDTATFALLRNEGLTEFDPVKVDRISPEDASSIRAGGTAATLRGTEFYNFGAFFSRAYRENDYLWGRLHGAERMIDLVCSTLDQSLAVSTCAGFKRAAFLAILDEEQAAGRCASGLIEQLRSEVQAMKMP
ncbi:patatin-like protein [Porphyrobacter algicida]|uniref:Patatin-like protein n=1 Tax=Qipengyuania algicida TaxID=1836209 RepID=A0A845AGB6_9SPHN|nr:patatin-like protein [Qipengyuania algicida]MXP28449.1 patatin-like protein [Qipengyuania algicida]